MIPLNLLFEYFLYIYNNAKKFKKKRAFILKT